MSQHFSGPVPERDCNDSPAFVGDHNEDCQEYEYASQRAPHALDVYHHNTLLSQVVAQTNGHLPLAQPRHDAGLQYPAWYPWHTDARTAGAFDVYQPGNFNDDAVFGGDAFNFQYAAVDTQPAFSTAPMASLWDPNGVQAIDQSNMYIPAGAQLNPAPCQTMVSAPPAPIPAPASAAAERIHCPHGCPATFGRGGEYRRHLRIHQAPRYRCPMVDCPRTFSRADKLRDHAKRGHGGRNPLNLS